MPFKYNSNQRFRDKISEAKFQKQLNTYPENLSQKRKQVFLQNQMFCNQNKTVLEPSKNSVYKSRNSFNKIIIPSILINYIISMYRLFR